MSVLLAPPPTIRVPELSAPPPFQPVVAAAFREMARERRSATLICESGRAKRLIFVRDGEVVGCRSNVKNERFGQLLLSQSFLTRSQLDTAVKHIRSGRRLGEIMVELGYFTIVELDRFVSMQVRNVASEMLFSDPTRMVYSNSLEIVAVTRRPVSFVEVFDRAASELNDLEAFREMFERSLPRRTEHDVPGRDNLGPEASAVWDVLDGRRSLDEIVYQSGLPEELVLRTLIGLREACLVSIDGIADGDTLLQETRDTSLGFQLDDVVGSESHSQASSIGMSSELPPEATTSTIDSAAESVTREFLESLRHMKTTVLNGDHWSVLGLAPGASRAAILSAFHDLCSRFHPDARFGALSPEDAADRNFVFARVHEAYRVLSEDGDGGAESVLREQEIVEEQPRVDESAGHSDPSPVSDESSARRLQAMAKEAYRGEDYWRAIQLSRQALDCGVNDPDIYFLLGKALSHNPRWRHDAEKNLSIASKLDPWNPRYFIALGRLYRSAGLTKRAEKMFSAARVVAPGLRLQHQE